MRVFHSLAALAGLILGAAGVFLAFTGGEDLPPQGRMTPAAADSSLPSLEAAPLGVRLDRPWHRPAPATPPPVVETPPPTPTPVPPRPAPNTSALAFLGKVVTEDQSTRYFFKERSSGFVLGLVTGETKGGWTLSQVDEFGYHLEGPGGQYEVPR